MSSNISAQQQAFRHVLPVAVSLDERSHLDHGADAQHPQARHVGLEPGHHLSGLALGDAVVFQELVLKHNLVDAHQHFGLAVDTQINVEAAAQERLIVRSHLVLLADLTGKVDVGNEQHCALELKAAGHALVLKSTAFLGPANLAGLASVQGVLEDVERIKIGKDAVAVVNQQHVAGLAAFKQHLVEANGAHAALDALHANLALRLGNGKVTLQGVRLAAARRAANNGGLDVAQHNTVADLAQHGENAADAGVDLLEGFGGFDLAGDTGHFHLSLCHCLYKRILARQLDTSTKNP